LLQPFNLIEGPQYASSLEAARAKRMPRFEEHLKAVRVEARLAPGSATPFLDDSGRVAESRDEANGYALWLYFIVDNRRFTSTLRWVEVSEPS
jgi:hypothetical protein